MNQTEIELIETSEEAHPSNQATPWPMGDGFAKVLLHRFEDTDGRERIEVEWQGPEDWPVLISGKFLRSITSRGMAFDEALSALLPWPMKWLGEHPTYRDKFIFRRLVV